MKKLALCLYKSKYSSEEIAGTTNAKTRPEIDATIIQTAIEYTDFYTREQIRQKKKHLFDSEYHKQVEEVKCLIRKAGNKGIRLSKITRTISKLNTRTRDCVLQTLEESNYIKGGEVGDGTTYFYNFSLHKKK